MNATAVLALQSGRISFELIDGCMHLEWRGLLTVQGVHDARQRLAMLALVAPWVCSVTRFDRCVIASGFEAMAREFTLPVPLAKCPGAWLVEAHDVPRFERLADHVAQCGMMRAVFTDGALALAWSQARARTWRAEQNRRETRARPAG